METLPLYTAAAVRELDRLAINEWGIEGYTLMTRAATALLATVRQRWPDANRLAVVCGAGNNGGDGLVLARLAREAGLAPHVMRIGGESRPGSDAARALADLEAEGLAPVPFDPDVLGRNDVVVDALLGTGIDRPVSGAWAGAIDAINAAGKPVLAVDVPSGLNSDTGVPMGSAIRASVCVSFVGRKQGLVTAAGPQHTGELLFDDLQIPPVVYERVTPSAEILASGPTDWLQRGRRRDAHKGMYGHVFVIGGDTGMSGAVRMAGEAALRTGAGLVSVATRPGHASVIAAQRPELMCHGVGSPAELRGLMSRATVVVAGPGLGRSEWAARLLNEVLETGLPLVLDADGLNLLADNPCRRGNWILTPHPGEAGRLLGCSAGSIQGDRFSAAGELVERYQAVCLLKGSGTLIAETGHATVVSPTGNPGMASGGMGDVLAGMVAGLVAQGFEAGEAARAGAWLHGLAGDRAAGGGERGLLASDLLAEIRTVCNRS